MKLTVKERGETVATFRYIQVSLMEVLAAWIPTTPEMEVKLLLGKHIWDVAQHADALGNRTYELRLPLQFSLQPSEPYLRVLAELSTTRETPQRLAVFYEVMLPALAVRYHQYLEQTDSLMDAPTVQIIERILADESRMCRELHELYHQLPSLRLTKPEWIEGLKKMESSIENFVHNRTKS